MPRLRPEVHSTSVPPRRDLGCQPAQPPRPVRTEIFQPVVQPARPSLPEFEDVWFQSVAAPIVWPWHLLARAPRPHFGQPPFQLLAAGYVCVGLLAAACSSAPRKLKELHLKAAQGYVADRTYDQAVLEYANALKQDRNAGVVHFAMAEA